MVLGEEAEGLGNPWEGRCDELLAIPMPCEADSLNVAVAAGFFLYALQTRLTYSDFLLELEDFLDSKNNLGQRIRTLKIPRDTEYVVFRVRRHTGSHQRRQYASEREKTNTLAGRYF